MMNSVSKVKIAVGYTLLLGVLFFSLFFVHREMENLMLSDNQDVHWTDSLITLLREKDENTIYMLRVLSETNDSMVSTREIENIIATQQDSVVTNRRVQHRIITHRDTVVTKPKKKGFFRRLGEVFVPPKKDTAIQVKTSLEYATDTVIESIIRWIPFRKNYAPWRSRRKKAVRLYNAAGVLCSVWTRC